jgi:tetratricopeptide (TPR) repeat protein
MAIDLDPEDEYAWYNLGCTLAKIGQTEEALKALNRATTINPLLSQPIT